MLQVLVIDGQGGGIGRALLLRQGQLIGDKSIEELGAEGKDLVQFVKESYHYRADRVSRALDSFASPERPDAPKN